MYYAIGVSTALSLPEFYYIEPVYIWTHIWMQIGKTWNACVFEIERPAGEERNRIRGAQRRWPQGA